MYILYCKLAYLGLLGSFAVRDNLMCRDVLNHMLMCCDVLSCMLACRETLKCMLGTINYTGCIQNAWKNFTREFSILKRRKQLISIYVRKQI